MRTAVQPISADLQPSSASEVRHQAWSARRRIIIGIIAALFLIGPVVAWNAGLHRYFYPTDFGVVEPGRIYRSGQISKRLLPKTLAENRIGLIINLSTDDGSHDAEAERVIASKIGIPRLDLYLAGNGTGNPDIYPKAVAAIVDAEKKGTPVLVHCQTGAQRTSGIIATYRILVQGKSEQEAFDEARAFGHDPKRNPKLIPFVTQHLPEWRKALETQGVIKPVQATTDQAATANG